MTAPTVILGVDPGASGAIAWLIDGRLEHVIDMPTADGRVAGALVAHELAEPGWEPHLAVVEDVHAMPKQGVSSTFKFGVSHGTVLGVLATLGVPVELVTPHRWKRHHGIGADKDRARRLAIERWPHAAGQFARKKDHGRAEAALIAAWRWDTTLRTTPGAAA
jgi:hypothetical protein